MWSEGRTSRLSPAHQGKMPRAAVLPASSLPPPGLPPGSRGKVFILPVFWGFFAGEEENLRCFLLPLRADMSQTKPTSLSERCPLFCLSVRGSTLSVPPHFAPRVPLASPPPRFHLMTKSCVPASEMPDQNRCSSSCPHCHALSSSLVVWGQCYYLRVPTGQDAPVCPPQGPPHATPRNCTCVLIKPGLKTLP